MRPIELKPENQVVIHLAARLYHTQLVMLGQGTNTPYAYLHGCGLTDATIYRNGIGYASGTGLDRALATSDLPYAAATALNLFEPATGCERMTDRLVFLDCDQSGRILNLIGQPFARNTDSGAPHYLGLSERWPLFGYARLDTRFGRRPILLVHDILEALLVRQWGFDAVASLEANLPKNKIQLLNGLKRPLLIVLNGSNRTWSPPGLTKGLVMPLPEGVKTLREFGEERFVAWLKAFGFERRRDNPQANQKAG